MRNRLGIACQRPKGHKINGKVMAAQLIKMRPVFMEISYACLPSTVSLTDVIESDLQGQRNEVQIPPQEPPRPKLWASQPVNHTCASAWV